VGIAVIVGIEKAGRAVNCPTLRCCPSKSSERAGYAANTSDYGRRQDVASLSDLLTHSG
jgi:hypothetical protein